MEKYTKIKFFGSSIGRLIPIIGYIGENPVAVFPIYYYKGLYSAVFSPPLGTGVTHLGPIIKDYENLKQHKRERYLEAFIKAVDGYMSNELNPMTIRIKNAYGMDDPRPFIWLNYKVKPMYDYLLNINNTNELFQSFKKDVRKSINESKKIGLSVREGKNSEIGPVWKMIAGRYEQQEKDFEVPIGLLRDLFSKFPENFRVFIVENKNKSLSGLITYCFKDTISLWMGNVRSEISGISPNDFLNWEIFRWASGAGYRKCWYLWANDKRLCKYKSKYNPELAIYHSADKDKTFFRYFKSVKKIKNRIRGKV
jgi:hypothetical protein